MAKQIGERRKIVRHEEPVVEKKSDIVSDDVNDDKTNIKEHDDTSEIDVIVNSLHLHEGRKLYDQWWFLYLTCKDVLKTATPKGGLCFTVGYNSYFVAPHEHL